MKSGPIQLNWIEQTASSMTSDAPYAVHYITMHVLYFRLSERMKAGNTNSLGGGRGGGGQGGGGGGEDRDRDSNISNLAALRAQRAMADRLSTTGRTNLPEGVMLHDDPMSKTLAFLSQMPALT
jgi:hypothetical protein